MEDLKDENLDKKFLELLKKITSNGTSVDKIYLDKLLSSLRSECEKNIFNKEYFEIPGLFIWLSDKFQEWKSNSPNISKVEFMFQFMGIICRNEIGFKALLQLNAPNKLLNISESKLRSSCNLRIAFIKFLCDLVGHKSGCEWIVFEKHCKTVLNWFYDSNTNFYIEQEGLKFFKKLLNEVKFDAEVLNSLLQEIISPMREIEKNDSIKNDASYSDITTSLKLLTGILKMFISQDVDNKMLKLSQIFKLEEKFLLLLKDCTKEDTIEMAASVLILINVLKTVDKKVLQTMDEIPTEVLNVFTILLQKNQIICIIKLSKFCQLLWAEMRNNYQCDTSIGMHFIIFQFIPMSAFKTAPDDLKSFDWYVQKLFNLISPSSCKFGFALKDCIKKKAEKCNWVIKGILSLAENMDSLKQDEAVVIFQFLAYYLLFLVTDRCQDENLSEQINTNLADIQCVDSSVTRILSAVLNALCLLINKFKINWAESLESLCLLKIACDLLESSNLPSILVIETFTLVKLAILNSMSLNLALLLNESDDSSFQSLVPLLYKHMHNPSWEIRDSCLEVIMIITELAESKFPSLQQLLLEKDFCSLIYDILEGDAESYVRASAIRVLSAMTKIESFRSRVNELDLLSKMIVLLRKESEGIVRREAVLLLKQIYLNLYLNPELCDMLYEIMGYAALRDLHWEVKVNSLLFWESVIDRTFADQGMLDGSFPRVTFSTEHKKIITITSEEIKERMDKAMKKFSKIGCLHVLASALNDDCDYQVVKKSAEIITKLMSTLRKFGVMTALNNGNPMKRKHEDVDPRESGGKSNCISVDVVEANTKVVGKPDSDAVIEEIVNEMDINLLVTVNQLSEKEIITREKILMREIKPEIFLMQMENFDSNSFLNAKQKWLMNSESDIKSLVNDIITVNFSHETNVMDCY